MKHVSEVMKQHLEFCNLETRVPDLKYILKKYNYGEVVIVDYDRHPIGLVKEEAVSDTAMKNIPHPFDVKAQKLMTTITATIKADASIDECIKFMNTKHMTVLPVVDESGHCLGVVKWEDLRKEMGH